MDTGFQPMGEKMSEQDTWDSNWDEDLDPSISEGEEDSVQEANPNQDESGSENTDFDTQEENSDEDAGSEASGEKDHGIDDGKNTDKPEEPKEKEDDDETWEQRYRSFEGRYRKERGGFESRISELEAELDRARQQPKDKRESDDSQGEQENTQEIDVSKLIPKEFSEEFPEFAEVIQSVFDAQNQQIKSLKQNVDESISSRVDPIAQKFDEDAHKNHIRSIREVHDDLDDLIGSGKVKEWIKNIPDPVVSDAYMAVYEGRQIIIDGNPVQYGTTDQVISLLNGYKSHLNEQENRNKKPVDNSVNNAVAVKAKAGGNIPKGRNKSEDFDEIWDE